MSVPSKPNKSKSPMNVYEDTDDDDLSDISERSREDDISDPVINKNSQSNIVEYKDDKRDKREFTSTNSDAGQEILGTALAGSAIIKARRFEQSDSDEADSQRAKQSATDTFYSPNESVEKQNDTDEDQEEEDEERSSNETSSNEGRKTPVPIGKMAFGEPYIYIIFSSVLYGLITNTMCVCGVSFYLPISLLDMNDITAFYFSPWNVCSFFILFLLFIK